MANKWEQNWADNIFHFPSMLTDGNVGPDKTEETLNAQCRVFALFKRKHRFWLWQKKETVWISHTPRTVSISNSESISGLSDSCSATKPKMDKSARPAGTGQVDLCVFFRSVDVSVHLSTLTALVLCAVCAYTQHIVRVGPVLGDFLKAWINKVSKEIRPERDDDKGGGSKQSYWCRYKLPFIFITSTHTRISSAAKAPIGI